MLAASLPPRSAEPSQAPGQGDQPVADLLRSLVGRSDVHFLPNPGNGGDAFIDVGFFDLARSIGLTYEIIDPSAALTSADVLILAGGGNLVPEYGHMATAIARYRNVVDKLIVLPQSIRGHEDVLRGMGANVHVFAREKPSYEYCAGACGQAHVDFDHDMAFHADIGSLKRRRGLAGFRLSRQNLARLALVTLLKLSARRNRRLLALRTDREAPPGARGRLRTDVSKICTFGTSTEAECYFSAAQFIQTIDLFDEVETDRLHVAIAAARLGKRTILRDNSYYKCRAVYEASLTGFDVNYVGAAVGLAAAAGRS